jgi:hypothetical protein
MLAASTNLLMFYPIKVVYPMDGRLRLTSPRRIVNHDEASYEFITLLRFLL